MKRYDLLRHRDGGTVVEARLNDIPVASITRAPAGRGFVIAARQQGVSLTEVLAAIEAADRLGFWSGLTAEGPLATFLPTFLRVEVEPVPDGWRLFDLNGKTYRARLKAGADPALWPAAHVEAEHATTNGFRETKRPDTLIALHRLLVGRSETETN